MRHGDKINNLGRTAAHRRALLANMAIALIEHKRITTTVAKAKALRRYVEPLITKSKDNTTHSRRIVFGYLQNKAAITELFGPIAAKIADRPGGYVRVIKLGFRVGDGAETAMIEFVDYNEVYNPNAGKVKTTKKTRRGGSGSGASTAKKAGAPPVADEPIVIEEVVETPVVTAAAPIVIEEVVETPVVTAPAPIVIEEVVETPVVAAEAAPEVSTPAPVEDAVADATDEAPAAEEKKDDEAA